MRFNKLSSRTRRTVLRALSIALLAGLTATANAQIVFDDASGNASSNGASPTALTFNLGSNIVNGTVTTPANTRNFYTFTIGASEELTAINLDSLNVTTAAGAPSSDPGFFALVEGDTASIPGAGFANLGGGLFAPGNVGIDLLSIANPQSTGGTGLPAVIGAGDYTFVIQQTGSEVSNFSLDFQVSAAAVPEPTSGILLAGLGLAGLARRRRR